MPKPKLTAIQLKRNKLYQSYRVSPTLPFGTKSVVRRKALTLDPKLKALVKTASFHLRAPDADFIRLAVSRLIQQLPNLYVEHGRKFSSYALVPMVHYPIKDYFSFFKPVVDPTVLAELKLLPARTTAVLMKKAGVVNVPASFDIDAEFLMYLECPAKCFTSSHHCL
jgi:hypothetical protein